MRLLVPVVLVTVLLAGCATTDTDVGNDEGLPGTVTRLAQENDTYDGEITGAGTPAGSANLGGSEDRQTISVNASAVRIYINVTIQRDAPQTEARVGFFCQTTDEGTTVCEENRTTSDGSLSWSTEEPGGDFDMVIFWDRGAGDMSWTADVTQLVPRTVPANRTG